MINNKYQLPQPIEAHFQATNTDEPVAFLSIFTENAVVFDAGKEYHGKAGSDCQHPFASLYDFFCFDAIN